jgi:Tol biopolymer transport system component
MYISPNHRARRRVLGLSVAVGGSLALVLAGAAPGMAASAKTTLASVSSGGVQANSESDLPSISSDGRFIAFATGATNLEFGQFGGTFVRDRKAGTTRPVAGNGHQPPSISADGRFVAYSDYTNVFVYDRTSGETRLVSADPAGQPTFGFSASPSISADGRFVAFSSDAQNLTPVQPRVRRNEYVRDLKAGKTVQVNVNSNGQPGNGLCHHPSISASGRFVAFESNAGNLAPGAAKGRWNVFVRDLKKHTTTLASVNSAGKKANGASHNPVISGDGRYAAFESKASNLVGHDTNKGWDVFRRDLKKRRTARVSVSSLGKQGNRDSRYASISNHGGFIAFYSAATNLVKGDTNHIPDFFVRDEHNGRTTRVDVSSTGHQANRAGPSFLGAPSISADGRFVAFSSGATNLVKGDTNHAVDVFVRGPLR